MKWSHDEVSLLSPIVKRVKADLEPAEGKHILVLCSASGDLAFELANSIGEGKITGLELNQELLELSRNAAQRRGAGSRVEFLPAEKISIPFPDAQFDGIVSEFIVFPTSAPTEIGQPEMARVIREGGRIIVTDVIVTKPMPLNIRAELAAIGLDYLCEGTEADFRTWMTDAGMKEIQVDDVTSEVKTVWEHRRQSDREVDHQRGYAYLLDDPTYKLGEAIFYIYVRGIKE